MSSIASPWIEARKVLGVSAEADASEVKRAYRRRVVEHPPDRDPEGFREVRDAYEMLSDPMRHALSTILQRKPAIPPPTAPAPPEVRPGGLPLALLRAVAMQIDAGELLQGQERKGAP